MFQGLRMLVFALVFIPSTGAVADSSPILQHRDLQRTAQGITIILDYSKYPSSAIIPCMHVVLLAQCHVLYLCDP